MMTAFEFPGPLDGSADFQEITDEQWCRMIRSLELSARQEQLVLGIVAGLSTTEIARAIGRAPDTVRTHSRRLFRKLGVHSREELIVMVITKLHHTT